MPELKDLFASLGYTAAETYVQSGNVVFRSRDLHSSDLARSIEQGIGDRFGHSVKVLLRTEGDLARIVNENPFLTTGSDPTKLHVTFLGGEPEPSLLRAEDIDMAKPDEFRLVGGEIYLHCPEGYGRTKLNNAFWERRLKLPATTRNWKTVCALTELVSA
jgi:uncharacterized protein (DUF1697 family)